MARKRFAGQLSFFRSGFSLWSESCYLRYLARVRTLLYAVRSFSVAARCISLFRAVFVFSFFSVLTFPFRCASAFSDLSLGKNRSAYGCRLMLLSIRALP